jgi:hypothetical protein
MVSLVSGVGASTWWQERYDLENPARSIGPWAGGRKGWGAAAFRTRSAGLQPCFRVRLSASAGSNKATQAPTAGAVRALLAGWLLLTVMEFEIRLIAPWPHLPR